MSFRDSIIMQGVTIGENCVIDRAIIAEDTVIGDNVVIGIGSDVPNKMKPNITVEDLLRSARTL